MGARADSLKNDVTNVTGVTTQYNCMILRGFHGLHRYGAYSQLSVTRVAGVTCDLL